MNNRIKLKKPLTRDSSILHIAKLANISPGKFYKNKLKRIKHLYTFSADDFVNIFKFGVDEFGRLNYILVKYGFKPIEGCKRYLDTYRNYTPLFCTISREEFLNRDVWELELPVRPTNVLYKHGINTIKQLTNYTSLQLEKLPGMGAISIETIVEKMYLFGV